jgi:hypothetical protein
MTPKSGPDHVDCHRSPFLVISAYSRPGTIHRFVNTTDVVAAIEDILGLDRLSSFDYFSRSLADVFSETADLSPWGTAVPQVDLNEKNAAKSLAARASAELDFSEADRAPDDVFNKILWRMIKGEEEFPVVKVMSPVQSLAVSR